MSKATTASVYVRAACAVPAEQDHQQREFQRERTEYAQLAQIAERIRERARRRTKDIVETGRDLQFVKESLGHGAFGRWIADEFGMDARSAQNFMRVAELAADPKYEIISYLPPTVAFLLAAKSTPPKVRERVIEQAEKSPGRVAVKLVRRLIAEARADTSAGPGSAEGFAEARDSAEASDERRLAALQQAFLDAPFLVRARFRAWLAESA